MVDSHYPSAQEEALMISGIYSSLSALFSFQKKMESTANNIANADTDGFKKTRVLMEEQVPQGVKPVVDRVEVAGPTVMEETAEGRVPVEQSNVDLFEELPEMGLTQRLFEANIKAMKTQEEMKDSVLDLKA